MYTTRYKQKRIWVPRDSEENPAKLERQAFVLKLDELTRVGAKSGCQSSLPKR